MANNLTRYDPFGELTRMNPLRAFDDFFRELGPRGALRELAGEPTIALDVTETDQAYTVRAEIPGVKKEDIKVEVHGNRVSISAETRRESVQKEGSRTLRNELYYGQMQRMFTLDQDLDEGNAQARYENGVLELTLPKRAAGAASKLQVQ